MIFTAPFVLSGLAALPVLYFLLRLNPPPARRLKFPPLALLQDLTRKERTKQQTPLWLLILRLAAAALTIFGLAGPVLHPPSALPGSGPILLVIDNGWASAADWQDRIAEADHIIKAADKAGRSVSILATATGQTGEAPQIQGVFTAAQAGQIIAALQPLPWPVERAAATLALQAAPKSTRFYIADGITDGSGFTNFFKTLAPDRVIANPALPALLAPYKGGLTAHLLAGSAASLLAEDAGGNVLGQASLNKTGDAEVALPLPVASKITALKLDGPLSAGGVLLLDASAHATLAGLAAGSFNAESPYLGSLYFIRRALPQGTEVITGDLASLIAAKPGLIILADVTLSSAQQIEAQKFIAAGGVLLRFAGPLMAASPDALSPSPLLDGDRRLGGALSWTVPLGLAAFPQNSPFYGLPAEQTATVSRQILADPTRLDPATVWASLADGTPLILGKAIGKGYLVAVLTSANTDWSSLALSGIYPTMLARLTILGHAAAPNPNLKLPLSKALSPYGVLSPAGSQASLSPAALATAMISPAQPPGLYGSGSATLALNLGGHVPPPFAANLPGATPLTGQPRSFDLGADLIALALLLLIFDLMLSLWLRGLVPRWRFFVMALLVLPCPAHAQNAALQTELGYIRTNDPAVDQVSADGLGWLSEDVSAHTSAQIGVPAGLDPAVDDLAFYPMIYFPVTAATSSLPPVACTALNNYMAHGGLLVIDTAGGEPGAPGSGAGFAAGSQAALQRVTSCLNLPPLQPLTTIDVLAHCFYILQDFPGLFTGAPVFVAAPAARDADGVTPVIIGQNFWAAAWARDANNTPEQTPMPGGEAQREIAGRFGTNLVIYALTGDYKADQAAAPSVLNKIGQ